MFDRSRRRLAYWFTLSMGSILILFAFTVYQRQVTEKLDEFDAELYARAKKIATATNYRQQGNNWAIDTENVSLSNRTFTTESKIVCLRWYDARQRLIEFIGKCSLKNSLVTQQWQTIEYRCNHKRENQPIALRVLSLPLKQDRTLVGYLQVAMSLEAIDDSLGRSRLFLAIGIPITLAITGIAGWLLAGFAMHPVKLSYEQLQRFTADASHELRAPVAAILSNAQVGLLAPLEDTQQPRQRLENIVTQSKYMSDLIGNLLFLARHQGKLNPQDIVKTDIVELLNSLADRYGVIAEEKAVKFKEEIPSVAKELYGDRDLLQQAINNLLDNAIKYTPSGGIVTLKLEVKPRRILITVKDTGMGIPEADLDRIFDRFYRVDKARTRQTGGFGLGLAIARQIILAHNGKISVKSEVSKGTIFQICLPTNFITS